VLQLELVLEHTHIPVCASAVIYFVHNILRMHGLTTQGYILFGSLRSTKKKKKSQACGLWPRGDVCGVK